MSTRHVYWRRNVPTIKKFAVCISYYYTIERNEGLWLADWDPTFGMLLLANFYKYTIRFYNDELERKITKGNNKLTPRMHSIIRCCSSRFRSRCRCCTFERKSRCNETIVMRQCLNAGANHIYNVWIVHSHEYPRHATNCLKVKPRIVLWLTSLICLIKGQLQRFYKLISYERAVKILKNDRCVTEIVQADLEIFEFKVKFPRKIPKIRNFANVSIIKVEQ